MELIDTHCHIQSIGINSVNDHTTSLWSKLVDKKITDVVRDAKEDGVTKLIVVGCSQQDSSLAVDLVQSLDNSWASIGIHPHEAKFHLEHKDSIESFKKLVSKNKVVAVGECGLDYFYDHSPRAEQIKILKTQIELALAHNLPQIFHVRQAFSDFWPIFNSYNSSSRPIRGVLHSFTDDKQNLDIALNNNLMIGVNGIATFAKNADQIEVYKQIPITNLLLETDSPYLTPTPIRGTINEPKNVGLIAAYLAELRGESLSLLASQTTANALKLFSIS